MLLVFGRGDIFKHHLKFNLDIWKTKNNQYFMRCWSRCEDIDWASYEIKGIDPNTILKKDGKVIFHDIWIPEDVRNAYEEWIKTEF